MYKVRSMAFSDGNRYWLRVILITTGCCSECIYFKEQWFLGTGNAITYLDYFAYLKMHQLLLSSNLGIPGWFSHMMTKTNKALTK